MKKTLLLALALLIAVPSLAQEEKKKKNFFKELYADFLKYGTVYAAVISEMHMKTQEKTFL